MPSTVPELLAIIRPLLNDAVAEYRFSDGELVRWLSDAQREIVRYKPEANPITAIHVVDGSRPYQKLSPDIATVLIRVEANGAAVPEAPPTWGNIVRRVDRHALDSIDSAWGYRDAPLIAPAAGTYFKEWSIVPDNELAFYLYPAPNPLSNNDVLVTYAGLPPEIASAVATLTLSEVYDFDIINYVLYRATSDQAQGYSKQGADAALTRFTANLTLDRAEVKRLGTRVTANLTLDRAEANRRAEAARRAYGSTR